MTTTTRDGISLGPFPGSTGPLLSRHEGQRGPTPTARASSLEHATNRLDVPLSNRLRLTDMGGRVFGGAAIDQ